MVRSGRSIKDLIEPVYIHFEFNNYKPELMNKENAVKFSLYRMIPPGEHSYFYTVDMKTEVAIDCEIYERAYPKILKDITYVEDGIPRIETLVVKAFNRLKMKTA